MFTLLTPKLPLCSVYMFILNQEIKKKKILMLVFVSEEILSDHSSALCKIPFLALVDKTFRNSKQIPVIMILISSEFVHDLNRSFRYVRLLIQTFQIPYLDLNLFKL